jgi:hypothetical protein
MLDAIPEVLAQLGIPSGVAGLLYLIVNKEASHRKEDRDAKMNAQDEKIKSLESNLDRHVAKHDDWEKTISGKTTQIYERLNPIGESVKKIEGYLEGMSGKPFRRGDDKG